MTAHTMSDPLDLAGEAHADGGNDEQLLGRVRELLDQHERQPDQPAGRHALVRARALLLRQALERGLLDQPEPESAEPVVKVSWRLDAPYTREKAMLLGTVARYFQCKALVDDAGGWAKGAPVLLYGHKSDVTRARMMFASITAQALDELAATDPPAGEDKATYRASWLLAFMQAVGRSLQETRRTVLAEHDGDATAEELDQLVEARRERVLEIVRTAHPETKPVKAFSSGTGWDAGRAAGEAATALALDDPASRAAS